MLGLLPAKEPGTGLLGNWRLRLSLAAGLGVDNGKPEVIRLLPHHPSSGQKDAFMSRKALNHVPQADRTNPANVSRAATYTSCPLSCTIRAPGQVTASFRPKKKNGHADTVLDSASCGPEKYVGKEAMSMCAHRYQIATLLLNPFDDFVHRFAIRQFSLCGNAH